MSLSAVSLRSGSQAMVQAEARANARLALMLAIGELQKHLGPDQRVSASGAIVSESSVRNLRWTGVWDSWKAGAAKSGDDITSEHSTIAGASNAGMDPTYQAQRKDHFRSWLLSLNPQEAERVTTPSILRIADNQSPAKYFQPDKNTHAVWLVPDGSLGKVQAEFSDYVAARLLSIGGSRSSGTSSSGRYGWWVGDESQKARIMDDSYTTKRDHTLAGRLARQQSPGSTGTTTIKGLENITNDGQLAALASRQTLDLITGASRQTRAEFPQRHSLLLSGPCRRPRGRP